MKKILVLGGGLVGGPMALDLAAGGEFAVAVADIDEAALAALRERQPALAAIRADLGDAATVSALAARHDLVVSAVPGFMGFATLRAILESGRSAIDIAFFPEDPFALDALAKSRGATAIVDCGVAPGLSNLLVGRAAAELDAVESALILVGGLPEVRQWPYEYKAVFSPIDVIEEYTRPARYVENGVLVTRPALSDPERIDFPGLGTLEAFNTDGLRTLARTIDAPNLKEKTLRYPGHIEKMAVLRETGFFDQREISFRGTAFRPIDLTAALLFPKWKLGPDEVDVTAMEVRVDGRKAGAPVRRTFRLLDKRDAATGVHSMARTTGYTATAAARLLAAGLYRAPGVVPPEIVGRDPACFEFILRRLGERRVVCTEEAENGAPLLPLC
jgi:saccharopine dehydrogenase-like NADP-dependent oxidoreductase